MGIGGVENAGFSEVAQIGLVFLDLLVATRQVERDLGHVVDVAVADVPDLQPCGFDFLSQLQEVLEGCLLPTCRDADVLDAELLGELKIFVAGIGGDLQ